MAGCKEDNPADEVSASVALVDASGKDVGTAQLTENDQGIVTLTVKANGLPAGTHGIHFHEVGIADPQASPPFSTAGEHYNPAAKQHGLNNPNGVHAGDLPNLQVGDQGTGTLTTTTDRITLKAGPATAFDANGTALIIHANADDQVTDPSGNSGGRIAGGVVKPD
ncbi:MAG: superoxide dismutase family protein [Ferruginibacter sp.]|nr:superoxide dismutase family protein [Cytophagales bacterium]